MLQSTKESNIAIEKVGFDYNEEESTVEYKTLNDENINKDIIRLLIKNNPNIRWIKILLKINKKELFEV